MAKPSQYTVLRHRRTHVRHSKSDDTPSCKQMQMRKLLGFEKAARKHNNNLFRRVRNKRRAVDNSYLFRYGLI